MLNINIEDLRRLPRRASEVWQGGATPLPRWVADEAGRPVRPWTALWVAAVDDQIGFGATCASRDEAMAKLGEGLQVFALDTEVGGYLPGRIEVRDQEFAAALREAIGGLGISIQVHKALPALDAALTSLTEHMAGPPPQPSVLTGKRVTLDGVRRFAEAAARFHRASLWQHLLDEDLIAIESPKAPAAMKHVAILGAAGMTEGIAFYANPGEHWAIQRSQGPGDWFGDRKKGIWSLFYGDLAHLPIADADLWVEHDLPVASERAYPFLICMEPGGGVKRADARMLAFVTGLLSALAATNESQIDAGRWTIPADQNDGMEFTLALPDLLAPPHHQELMRRGIEPDRRSMEKMHAQIDRFLEGRPLKEGDDVNEVLQREFLNRTIDEMNLPPRSDLEAAQDLCFEAFDAIGRRQYLLARQAMQKCPDCADAYVLLAERQSDPARASELYRQGMEAAERALGEQRMQDDAGHFWGVSDTRPYMRARYGLAQTLETLGRDEEAAEHYGELLRLNPGDNQGVRYLYLPLLLKLSRDVEAARYMKKAPQESTASWTYTRALLAYRLGGNCPTSRSELAVAIKANPYVMECLRNEPPVSLPQRYSPGSKDEAAICAEELRLAIEATPGAMAWLQSQDRTPIRGREQRHFKERKRRSR